MSKVSCQSHFWRDGVCERCGVVDEQRKHFADETAARAERFSRLRTPASAAAWSKKGKP